MMAAKVERCGSIIGLFGREYNENAPIYDITESGSGLHKISLMRGMLVDWGMCHAFNQLSPLVESLALSANTPWNGEDIFMSLVVRKVTGQLPYIVSVESGDYADLDPGPSDIAVSNGSDHVIFRGRFLRHVIASLTCVNMHDSTQL